MLRNLCALMILASALAGCAGGGGGSTPLPGTPPGTSTPPGTTTPTGSTLPAEARALWVTRWAGDTRARVEAAIDYADAHNLNMVLLQVYGDGAALYPSQVAPRSSLTSGNGFDPLAFAVPYAHARGIEVHAWMNACRVFTGGSGQPSNPDHVLRLHPEWAVVTSAGVKHTDLYGQPGTEIHACPENQGFRDYTVAVAREIAANYAVDGVHLDYIRLASGADVCWCAEHQRKFQAQYGKPVAPADPDWSAFRYGTITGLVSEVYDALAAARPAAKLSAAKTSFFSHQDVRGWFRRGKLDLLFPMIYTGDTAAFTNASKALQMDTNGRHLCPGVDVTSGKLGEEIDIARQLGLPGFALFSSSGLVPAHDPILAARFPTRARVPPVPWKDGTPDATPPLATQPSTAALADQVSFDWSTDELAAARVELWPTAAGAGAAAIVPGPASLDWSHRLVVTGLQPGTQYTFHVVSTDAAGNWRSSADTTVTTQAAGNFDATVDDGDQGYVETGFWSNGSSQGGNGGDYRYASRALAETAAATWQPQLGRAGRYRVSAWYVAGTNRTADAKFTVSSTAGSTDVTVDQQQNGLRWNELGTFSFAVGNAGFVRLSNEAASPGVVVADAVKFEYLGP